MLGGGDGGADPPARRRSADKDDWDDPDAAAAADEGGGGGSDSVSSAFVVDMDALRRRLSSVTAVNRGDSSSTKVEDDSGVQWPDLSADQVESFRATTFLHIIVFPSSTRSGESSSADGVYTLQLDAVNVVVTFAQGEDAERFALMLQAQDFPAPGVPMTVTAVKRTELQDFCDQGGHRLGFIPADAVVIPPEGVAAEAQEWLESSRGASTTSKPAAPSPPPPLPPLSRQDQELRDRLNRLYDQ
ncbi:hypothetical protein MMPV_008748 [Pyropia vietnamensis]